MTLFQRIKNNSNFYDVYTKVCTDNEFVCKNGWQCVTRVDVCDGFPSCINDGSDEVGWGNNDLTIYNLLGG